MSNPGSVQRFYEVRVSLTGYHASLDRAFGTADCVVVNPAIGLVEVIDLKYGAGKFVDVVDNVQLRMYALATLVTMKLTGITRVKITIVQPRIAAAEPIRSEEFSAIDLMDWGHTLIEAAQRVRGAEQTFKDFGKDSVQFSTMLSAGGHCGWCRAITICPRVTAAAAERAKVVFAPVAAHQHLDPAVLDEYLSWVEPLTAWIKAVDEMAYARANSGVKLEHWKLVQKRALRKWRDESQVAAALEILGVPVAKLRHEPKLLSPAQLEAAGVPASVIEALCTKVSSGTTLVPRDDKRTEVVVQSVEDVFKPVVQSVCVDPQNLPF